MPLIAIASHNPVKIQAALGGFRRMFPDQKYDAHSLSVDSGVGDQPRGDEQTLQGALNRALACREAFPSAAYWVGIEGGVSWFDDELAAFAWVVVTDGVRTGKARTGTFFLPPQIAHLVAQGYELGEADDIAFGVQNSKQANGAVGLLTGDALDRQGLYEQAVLLALLPFKNLDLYP
jgi:inosine/xanthosine triphosphatase